MRGCGSYASPAAFGGGFAPAIAITAGFALAGAIAGLSGAIAGLWLPRRRTASARTPVPAAAAT